ncbi:MAG: winged helix-turn-helix domain-containing protein [Actinomycetota bacterium]|nr:winged helix-turn-helix domain-containing protein [Actinomycetota bacterium]
MTTLSRRGGDRVDPITSIDDARYVKAMSHPLRVRILALLDERTASPVELAGWLGAPLGTVAYHVRTLERMGLIELTRQTRVRGAVEHHYRSTTRPRVSDEAWAAAPPIAKQAAVSASLQTVDAYARAASAAGGFDHGNSHLTRTAMRLDARGFNDLSRACLRLLAQVDRIEQAASERIERNPHSGETKDIALVMMLFEAARLTAENPHDPSAATRRRPRHELSAPVD